MKWGKIEKEKRINLVSLNPILWKKSSWSGSFLSLYSCLWYNFDVFFDSARRWMRRLLWRRIQRNRSPKSRARLSLSSIINYNLITAGAQRSLLTFLSHKIWGFGIQVKQTTTQFQVHVHGKPVHTFQLRILNGKTGNWKVWRNSVFHAPFSVFQFSSFGLLRHQFFKLENWKTGETGKV